MKICIWTNDLEKWVCVVPHERFLYWILTKVGGEDERAKEESGVRERGGRERKRDKKKNREKKEK